MCLTGALDAIEDYALLMDGQMVMKLAVSLDTLFFIASAVPLSLPHGPQATRRTAVSASSSRTPTKRLRITMMTTS